MEDTRQGFLTPEQEKQADNLKEWANKAMELADGLIIQIGDNQVLERLKPKLVEKFGEEILPTLYSIVDAIFDMLPKKED